MAIKILFSDTSEMVNEVMLFAFENEGFNVTIAKTPEEILNIIKKEFFDLIIVNWEFNTEDNLFKKIKQNSAYKDTKIFAISNTDNLEVKKTAKQNGVSGWITKAFIPEQLVKAIRYFMLKYEHKML